MGRPAEATYIFVSLKAMGDREWTGASGAHKTRQGLIQKRADPSTFLLPVDESLSRLLLYILFSLHTDITLAFACIII